MKLHVLNNPAALLAIFTIVLCMSSGCAKQDDGAAGGASKPSKQPAQSAQADAPTPQPENQETTKDDTPQQVADTVYTNGKIYTVNEALPWAEAVAIKEGTFIKVGSNDDVKPLIGDDTNVVDLAGKMVIPGLIDAHSHPGVAAYDLFNKWALPSFVDKPTWPDLRAKLEEGAEKLPQNAPWFLGHSYTRTAWPEEKYNRQYLDEVFGDTPAFLYMEGQHESIVNSKAIEIAGLTKETPDPPGGKLGRDPKTGELNGVLYEDPAANLVERHIPPLSLEKKSEGLIRAIALLHGYGYTGAFDAQYGNDSTVAAYGKLLKTGELPMHIKVVVDAFGYGGPAEALDSTQIKAIFDKHEIPESMRAVKVQMDGSIEGHTSVMLEGYADKPGGFNSPLMAPKEKIRSLMQDYDQAGLQILTHSIGDGTVRVTLDLFEELIKALGSNALRHKIDHTVVISEEDIPRFAELGVPVCPLFVVNQDMAYTRQLFELLGPQARTTLLPNGRLFKSGAIVAGTADWPGSPIINPFVLMEVTVTRQAPGGHGDSIGAAEDRLTVEQAVKSFTWNGAWTMGLDNETGSIENGKWADFVVLDQNLFDVPATEIHKTEALKTVYKGTEVYDASIHQERVEEINTEEIWRLLDAFQCRCRSPYRKQPAN